MENVPSPHIEKTLGVMGGKARIAGHSLRVLDIVAWHERRGMSPDEIVTMFPGISLAEVYAALAYYFDHREEIEAEFRQQAETANALKARFPSKLQDKQPLTPAHPAPHARVRPSAGSAGPGT